MTLQDLDLTPRTANKIAEAAAANSATKKRAAKPKVPKVHKVIVDLQTELAPRPRIGGESQSQGQTTLGGGGGSMGTKEERLAQGLIKKPSYLPSTVLEMRLLEIQKNPRAHFFPGMGNFGGNKENETFYAGPPGLPKQLQSLFSFQIGRNGTVLGARRPAQAGAASAMAAQDKEAANKRARSATAPASDAPEMEIGRERESSALGGFEPLDLGNTHGAADDFAIGGGMDTMDDFQLDLGDQDAAVDIANASRAIMEKTPSRMGSMAPLDASLSLDLDAIDRARNSMLAVFDSASKASQSTQQATTSTPMKRKRDDMLSAPGTRATEASLEEQEETQASNATAANGRGRTGGWSRNTVKAMKILEHELGPAEEAKAAQKPKELSFGTLADKVRCPAARCTGCTADDFPIAVQASRKAAASMFFEMLILGSRDCIKLEQKKPHEDISIQAKPKLWEVCDGLNNLTVEERSAIDPQESREATPVPSSARRSRVARSESVAASVR